MLKELQALGLDVRVLREDDTEVELAESVDYSDMDIRSIIEGDSKRYNDNEQESFGAHGFSKQEFEGEELVDIEEDSDFDEDAELFESSDDMDFE